MIIDEKQLEDVARAICLSNLKWIGQPPEWKEQQYIDAVNEDWPDWTSEAKAAIEAAFKPRPIDEAVKDGRDVLVIDTESSMEIAYWSNSLTNFAIYTHNGIVEIEVDAVGYIPIPQDDK